MDIFVSTLQQMLTMFTFILIGYTLRKLLILPEGSDTTMSRLEAYIFVPALSLSNCLKNCTVQTFVENYHIIFYGAIILTGAIILAHPLSRLFIRKANTNELLYQRNIYKYAMTFGNYGFMGNFIMLAVFGSEAFFRYQMFTLLASIVCNGWGMYILIPKEMNSSIWTNFKNGLLKPPIIAIFVGIILGLLNVRRFIPEFLIKVFSDAGSCQGPVAMVLAGFVIGGYKIKDMLLNKKVYAASALRLVVIPAFMMIILHALGTSKDIMTLALICFATPLGLNTIVYPAAYGGDTKTGAAMATISHTFSVITIPLMYLVFIVWL